MTNDDQGFRDPLQALTRVAVNALELARREIAQSADPAKTAAAAEHDRLVALLGQDGSLDELNRTLCQRIAGGDFDLAHTRFVEHLRATTLAKLAVDQPAYASYARALAEWNSGRE